MNRFRGDIDDGVERERQHDDDAKLLERAWEAAKEACDMAPLMSDKAEFHMDRMRAMSDMAATLRDRGARSTLTDKQRKYAKDVLGEPEYENLVSSGKVPRGKEVETPEVLKPHNLPKFPPGRTK